MTITVTSIFEEVSINNTSIPETGVFILTSGYTKVPQLLPYTRRLQNARYSTIIVEFPVDFAVSHFNGIYYYNIEGFEAGYVKIITDPGGSNGAVPYIANPETENRESQVYYRPQY